MEEIKILVFGAAGVWATWKIGRAVKNGICQWADNRVRRQHEKRLAALTAIPDLHKKEECKAFEEMATNLAKELKKLKSNMEQERDVQQTEIQTLQEKLHMMTCLMQEKEATFQQKVAEEAAKTAQANAKFAQYKKELACFNREHQNYLQEERSNHKNLTEKLHTEIRSLQEKLSACAQKLEKVSAKMAWEGEVHREEIADLKIQLERTTSLWQQNTTALLQKLFEEEGLRRELDSKRNEEMAEHKNMVKFLLDENEILLEQLRLTEESERSALLENEELKGKLGGN